MIEHRQKLLQERVRAKNGCARCCAPTGSSAPRGVDEEGGGLDRAQELPTTMDRLQRDILLERLGSLRGMIRRVEEALGEIAE